MYKFIAVVTSLLLCVNVTCAQVADSFESRIESVSALNKSIQCDFVQTKKVKNIKGEIVSNGEFYYDNSGMMALIYSQPQGDRVLINGETFTVVTAGKKIEGKAGDNPMMMQICNMLQACMSGDVTKLGRGWQMNIEENELRYSVTLQPSDRRTRKYIESLLMRFDKQDMTLSELRMNETSGGYTNYTFTNKEINGDIDPLKFK